jgi:hypothetical protein
MFRDLAAVGALAGAGWLIYRMEKLMADFEALNAKLDEQDAARTAAADRVAQDIKDLQDQIAALELDTADQAAVDAVTSRLQANIDALNGLDPVRADGDGQPTGGEPADGGEPAAAGEQA